MESYEDKQPTNIKSFEASLSETINLCQRVRGNFDPNKKYNGWNTDGLKSRPSSMSPDLFRLAVNLKGIYKDLNPVEFVHWFMDCDLIDSPDEVTFVFKIPNGVRGQSNFFAYQAQERFSRIMANYFKKTVNFVGA